MLARPLVALLLLVSSPGCKRAPKAAPANRGAVVATASRPDGPTIVLCASACSLVGAPREPLPGQGRAPRRRLARAGRHGAVQVRDVAARRIGGDRAHALQRGRKAAPPAQSVQVRARSQGRLGALSP